MWETLLNKIAYSWKCKIDDDIWQMQIALLILIIVFNHENMLGCTLEQGTFGFDRD
jgi:hypothetical protein